MNKFISANKHEFNVRRVSELDQAIISKENELANTTGFLNTFRVKSELKKLYKLINIHGSEVMEYEILNSNYN